jgi:rare lipoprotein A
MKKFLRWISYAVVALLIHPKSSGAKPAHEHSPPSSCKRPWVRASYYSSRFEGKEMANGRVYHGATHTVASRVYPLGSVLNVTARSTSRSLTVTVTDTGPWNQKFCLDLSRSAFTALGLDTKAGWGWVQIERIA